MLCVVLVSYQWLCELVDLEGISAEEIAEKLNRTGIEVETIMNCNAGVSGVVVGKVLETEKHPEADRLRVCKVDVGGPSLLQIICGAPNVAAGQLVPVAVVGAELSDLKIKKAKLRGIESFGMICSAKELGLDEKYLTTEQTEGILVLDTDAVIGEDICVYLGLYDQVINLELTPNRSDCLGMIGVAYEISAVCNRPLRLPTFEQGRIEASSKVQVHIEYEEDCPFYVCQVIQYSPGRKTPQWMKNRLFASGIRSINPIVDITNYVMLETGQPLHAFDYDRLDGGEIEVTRAQQGETVVTLDGVTRSCDHDTILIKNKHEAIAIAGIMGAKYAEVTNDSRTILVESAFFNPTQIRRASRKLGIRSEASARFEKGVDPEQIITALNRVAELLKDVVGADVASSLVGEVQTKIEDITIPLRHKRVAQVLGIQLESDEILEIFQRLHLSATYENEIYFVQIPTRRPDLLIEVDLIEEIARLYGYDHIPTTLLWGQQTPGSLTFDQKQRRIIRHTLRTLGMSEVMTYSLTSPSYKKIIGLQSPPIRLMAPLSKERSVLRVSLLPHLIETAGYNLHQDQKEISLFEIGRVFKKSDEESVTPWESTLVAGVLTQSKEPHLWKKNQHELDFYTVKGIVEALLTRIGIGNVEFTKGLEEGLHPGRTAQITVLGKKIGIVGELHPAVARQFDLKRTFVFELDLSKLKVTDKRLKYHSFARFPAVSRDIALIVRDNITAGDIKKEIQHIAGPLLESLSLFDVYTGEQVEVGSKSLAFSLVYRVQDRTLREEEVNQTHEKIVNHLVDKFAAKQRD